MCWRGALVRPHERPGSGQLCSSHHLINVAPLMSSWPLHGPSIRNSRGYALSPHDSEAACKENRRQMGHRLAWLVANSVPRFKIPRLSPSTPLWAVDSGLHQPPLRIVPLPMGRLGTSSKSLTSHSAVLARASRQLKRSVQLSRLHSSAYPRVSLPHVLCIKEGGEIPVRFHLCDQAYIRLTEGSRTTADGNWLTNSDLLRA